MVPRIRRPLVNASTLVGLSRLPTFPPAPSAPMPFIDRSREQAQALRLLEQRGVVAITGGVGSGKTALAATIVQQVNLPSFWVKLASGLPDPVETLLWQFARPLADGAPAVWRTLHRIVQSHWDYPALVRLQMILAAFAQSRHEVLFCISDVNWFGDQALEALLEGLCDYVAGTEHSQVKLVVEGQTLPYNVQRYALPPLSGLPADAIHVWAQQLGLALDANEAARIYHQTDGLAHAIKLLLDSLINNPTAKTIDNIVERREIRRFVHHLLALLPARVRALLEQLTRHPDQEVLPSPDALASIEILEREHLATVSSKRILIHPLIRSYYRYYHEAA